MNEIFRGSGEMASLCRSHDWASTPLGTPEDWPVSLRTTVGIVLESRRPMVLFWGPELVQIYNDAYRPSLGEDGRHPVALGQRARECWDEIWDTIGPQIDQVLKTGRATWREDELIPIERNGRVEDVYWTYSYAPVRGDGGDIEGVLVVVTETTRRVRARAQADALTRRLSTTLESITDAFFTLDRSWRFTFVNAEGERLLERSRDELLGRVMWDEFPESVESEFYTEYHRAIDEGTSVAFEFFYPPLSRWLAVSAYPSDEGLAVYLRDVTEQRATEARLVERERMLELIGRIALIGGWRVDLESECVFWSDEVAMLHGMPPGYAPSLEEALGFYAPEWREVIGERFRQCAASGTPFDEVLQIVRDDGVRRWVHAIGEAVRDEDGVICGMQGAFQDIQDLKEAQDALRESDRRFRQVAESLPLVVWSAEPDGRIDYQTRRMHDYAGITAEDLADHGWLETVHPDDLDRIQKAWSHSIETGDPYQIEYRLQRHDGAWRWHLVQAAPFRDEKGEIVKWFGSAIDIHEQAELKREAEALARRLSTTLESITDAFYLLDPDWRFAFVNEEAARVLQRSREEILGTVIWESFPATVGSPLEEVYRRAASSGTTASLHYHYPPLDRWFDIRAYPSAEGLAVYFRDVTKEREAKMRLTEQAELLDRAQDAILVRELDHTIAYWNAGAERLYQWDHSEVLGRSLRELLYEDPEQFDEATAAVLERGEWSGEFEHKRKDGTTVSVEGRWSVVHDENGDPYRILAINTDVTERNKLLQQFLRAQRMESIGTLAGGIAHDLNNVLAPILLSIAFLKEEIQQPELDEMLLTIEACAVRGAAMVQQVLGFARGMDRADMAVDLELAVEDLIRIARDTFPKNITIVKSIPKDLWPLRGDPTQIHQVFMNLFVNARDAMPEGGRITVTAENVELDEHYASMSHEASPGPHVRISVADTGTGMPDDVASQIFDPFFTTKEVDKGTGLGLSTVAAILKSHGGFVNVYSELGSGTMFRLYFPAASDTDEARVSARGEDAPRGNGETILVIDDESSIRDITRQTLEAFGYKVITATDGADAVGIYGGMGEQIDLVLTDMVMPIMDGPSTIHALKRMDSAVKIIGASGLGANARVLRALNSGVEHFLPKPYTATTLLSIIHRVLRE